MDHFKIYSKHSLHITLEIVNFCCRMQITHTLKMAKDKWSKICDLDGPFPKRRKRCSLANHIIVIVDHNG